jgi:hypothetical protein
LTKKILTCSLLFSHSLTFTLWYVVFLVECEQWRANCMKKKKNMAAIIWNSKLHNSTFSRVKPKNISRYQFLDKIFIKQQTFRCFSLCCYCSLLSMMLCCEFCVLQIHSTSEKIYTFHDKWEGERWKFFFFNVNVLEIKMKMRTKRKLTFLSIIFKWKSTKVKKERKTSFSFDFRTS